MLLIPLLLLSAFTFSNCEEDLLINCYYNQGGVIINIYIDIYMDNCTEVDKNQILLPDNEAFKENFQKLGIKPVVKILEGKNIGIPDIPDNFVYDNSCGDNAPVLDYGGMINDIALDHLKRRSRSTVSVLLTAANNQDSSSLREAFSPFGVVAKALVGIIKVDDTNKNNWVERLIELMYNEHTEKHFKHQLYLMRMQRELESNEKCESLTNFSSMELEDRTNYFLRISRKIKLLLFIELSFFVFFFILLFVNMCCMKRKIHLRVFNRRRNARNARNANNSDANSEISIG